MIDTMGLLSEYGKTLFILIPLAAIVWFVTTREQINTSDTSDKNTKPPAPTGTVDPEKSTMVLIVDDSAVVRARLKKLLVGEGYDVITANDGQEALEVLYQENIDILITDLEMPNLDGFGLIAHVQGDMLLENIPIVAITGHEELSAKVHACQGLFGIFSKPWNDRLLLNRLLTLRDIKKAMTTRKAV
jgi:CheY-like chemotaxis protein